MVIGLMDDVALSGTRGLVQESYINIVGYLDIIIIISENNIKIRLGLSYSSQRSHLPAQRFDEK